MSFITFKSAKKLCLKGKDVKLGMEVVGGEVKMLDSKQFSVRILKTNGEPVTVEAYGIEQISSGVGKIDLTQIAKLFMVGEKDISRPESGEIEILIGQEYAAFHPCRMKALGHLVLGKNDFKGFVVYGTHPRITSKTEITPTRMQARSA